MLKCSGCGAYLIEGTEKCPFCKEFLVSGKGGVSSDVTYKISASNHHDLIKNSTTLDVSPEKRRAKALKKRMQRIKGYLILGLMAAVLIALIAGVISLIVHLFGDSNKYTTAYYKDNTISLYYDGKAVALTEEAVSVKNLDEGGSAEIATAIESGELIKTSPDGKITYFTDKFDAKNNRGTLKVMVKDKAGDISVISEGANPAIAVSDDGKKVLFLKNANAKGNGGELWYWERGGKASKIADGVDMGRFAFSDDFKRAVYIKSYNYKTRCGDMYSADFGDFTEVKIDTEVYELYGLKDKVYIYSKNYDSDREAFDIYMKKADESVRVVMDSAFAPVMTDGGKYLFACGDKNDERYSLYRVRIDKMNPEKIISNMSEIVRVSESGKQVLYSKQFDNNVADYYIWTDGETELKVADGVDYTRANQIAVSEDFEKVFYIANYDENKNGGVLYSCEYSGDNVTAAEKISQDVYDCYVLKNKKAVYNKNYNSKNKFAELYVYDGTEREINPEINPRFVKIEDNNIICIYDYDSKSGGSLYVIDKKLKESKLSTDVFDFELKENGGLAVFRNKDSKAGRFDLYETDEDKSKISLIAKDIDGVLKY